MAVSGAMALDSDGMAHGYTGDWLRVNFWCGACFFFVLKVWFALFCFVF